MAAIKLINICSNSSFENNNAWNITNGQRIAQDAFDGKYAARLSVTRSNGSIISATKIPQITNHIYYYCFHSSGSFPITFLKLQSTTPVNYNINDTWTRWGILQTASNSNSVNYAIVFNSQLPTPFTITFDALMCIDLTEAYGVGNEPTIAWCNENIPYFEDSYTLAEGSMVIKNHQGKWVKAKKVYQKTSSGWSEITNKYTINSLFSKTKHIDVDYHEKKQSDTFLGHCRALIRPNNAGTSPVDVSKYNQVLTITTPFISTFASPLSDGNKTLAFTSTNNAIAINNVSTLPKFATDDWTIDWWEYRQDTTTSSSFKMGPTKGTSFMGCYQVGTNLCFYATRKDSSWDVLNGTVGSAVTRNTWVHHAIVRHKSDLLVFKNGTLVKTLKEVSDFIAASYFTISSNSSTPSITGNMDEFRISDFAVWTSDFTPKTTRYLNNGEEYDSLPRGDADDEFVLLGKEFKDDSLHGHEVTNAGCSIMAPTQIATASIPAEYKTIPAIDTQGKCVFELKSAAAASTYSTYRIEADIAIPDSTNNKHKMSGIGVGSNYNLYFGIRNTGYFTYSNGVNGYDTTKTADYGMHHYTLDLKNGKYSVDNTLATASFTFTTGTGTYPFYAGGFLNGSNTIIYHNEIIYRYTFYKNNNKVNDFFPVQRISDGVIGLFDIVTQTFVEPNVANVATVFPKSHDSVYYIDNKNYITLESYDLCAQDFSIEWWEYPIVNTCGTRFTSTFPDAYNNGSGGLLLGSVSTAPNIQLYGSYGIANGSNWTIWSQKAMTANTLNTWTHRRYERIGTVMYEYINGTKTNVYTCNNYGFWASSAFPMAIGYQAKDSTNVGSYFQGYMQNFRIHKGAIGNGTTAPIDDLTIPQLDVTIIDKGEGNKLPIPKREYSFNGVFYESGDGNIINNNTYIAYGNGAVTDESNVLNSNFPSSLKFDGENSGDGCSIEIPINLSKDFTIETWLNVWAVPAQTSALLSLQDSNNTNVITLLHGVNYGTLYVDSTDSNRITITPNNWHHYAIIKKGDRISWFYDGEFVDVIKQITLPNTISAILSINGNGFGDNFTVGSSGIYINDLYVTNKAIYNDNGFTPPEEYRELIFYDF